MMPFLTRFCLTTLALMGLTGCPAEPPTVTQEAPVAPLESWACTTSLRDYPTHAIPVLHKLCKNTSSPQESCLSFALSLPRQPQWRWTSVDAFGPPSHLESHVEYVPKQFFLYQTPTSTGLKLIWKAQLSSPSSPLDLFIFLDHDLTPLSPLMKNEAAQAWSEQHRYTLSAVAAPMMCRPETRS